jgi:hypothetical protein
MSSHVCRFVDRTFCLRLTERCLVYATSTLPSMLTDVRSALDDPCNNVGLIGLMDKWIRAYIPGIDVPKADRGAARTAMFMLMAASHIALVAAYAVYPFVFKTRRHDWLFILFTVCCVAHWFLMMGECWMGYLEKRLMYENYKLGSYPLHNWFFDVMPAPHAILLIACLMGAIAVAFTTVVLRNVIHFVSVNK